MNLSSATHKQRDEIKRLGNAVFGDDIESGAFLIFSNWLQQHYGIFALQDITYSQAPDIIEKLKKLQKEKKLYGKAYSLEPRAQTPLESATKAPQSKKLGLGDPMLRIAAKIYLKGFYEGQLFPRDTPPSIDDIVRITKEEMGLS